MPDVALKIDTLIYLSGFEEAIHAQHHILDPDIRKIPAITNEDYANPQLRVRFYHTNVMEVFAALHVRQEIRRLHPDNSAIQMACWQTDQFTINLWKSGELGEVPGYLKNLLLEREAQISQVEEKLGRQVQPKIPKNWNSPEQEEAAIFQDYESALQAHLDKLLARGIRVQDPLKPKSPSDGIRDRD